MEIQTPFVLASTLMPISSVFDRNAWFKKYDELVGGG